MLLAFLYFSSQSAQQNIKVFPSLTRANVGLPGLVQPDRAHVVIAAASLAVAFTAATAESAPGMLSAPVVFGFGASGAAGGVGALSGGFVVSGFGTGLSAGAGSQLTR